ncbi:hypothetical protein FA10DRAFT_54248 [Acaromyces ingoldii]|uniref:Uncharacterized protein n=1 Tax=Acaromyces ingoldii TaxID=215250 RepID=A0A316YAA0_9BASI|nr:hypothetical protein FA10DRAFT_54248 [Acaromyces ingoldii]PWN86596.1 hypothetical protein FA10DRAFT_54248 [Acaromyces ingoldii]
MDIFASSASPSLSTATSPGPISLAATHYRQKHQRYSNASSPRMQDFDEDWDEATVYFPTFARRGSQQAPPSLESGFLSGNELFEHDDATASEARSSQKRLSTADLAMIWDEEDRDDDHRDYDEEYDDEEAEDDDDDDERASSEGDAVRERPSAHTSRRTSNCSASTAATSVSTSTMSPTLAFARRPSNCVGSPPNAQLRRSGQPASAATTTATAPTTSTRIVPPLSPRQTQAALRRDISIHSALSLHAGGSLSTASSNSSAISGGNTGRSVSPRSARSTPPTPRSITEDGPATAVATTTTTAGAATVTTNSSRETLKDAGKLHRSPTLPKTRHDGKAKAALANPATVAFTAAELIAGRKRSSTGPPAYASSSTTPPMIRAKSDLIVGQRQHRPRQPAQAQSNAREPSPIPSPPARPSGLTPSPSRPAKATTTVEWQEPSILRRHTCSHPQRASRAIHVLRRSSKGATPVDPRP